MTKLIESVHAFVMVDPVDDTEGLLATFVNGTWIPMIAADLNRLLVLRPEAEMICRALGRPVKLIRLTRRTELDTLTPDDGVTP